MKPDFSKIRITVKQSAYRLLIFFGISLIIYWIVLGLDYRAKLNNNQDTMWVADFQTNQKQYQKIADCVSEKGNTTVCNHFSYNGLSPWFISKFSKDDFDCNIWLTGDFIILSKIVRWSKNANAYYYLLNYTEQNMNLLHRDKEFLSLHWITYLSDRWIMCTWSGH